MEMTKPSLSAKYLRDSITLGATGANAWYAAQLLKVVLAKIDLIADGGEEPVACANDLKRRLARMLDKEAAQ